MTEPSASSAREASAGAILRAERERQGLHIAALAAAIKVAPRKLDALEHDRWHELPDATFTRALAQTVCRTLKLDPRPVLERLPAVETAPLDSHASGLNAPFNERGGSSESAASLVGAIRPMAWAGVLLMVAAVALYLFPPSWLPAVGLSTGAVARAPAKPASTVVPVAPAVLVPAASAPILAAAPEPVASAPVVADAASAPIVPAALPAVAAAPAATSALAVPALTPTPAAPASRVAEPTPAPLAAAPAGVVQLRASANSWVEARDGRGRLLLSRLVTSGESLGLDGALPIRMTIGNAQATTLAFRGQPVDLQTRALNNIARVELQ